MEGVVINRYVLIGRFNLFMMILIINYFYLHQYLYLIFVSFLIVIVVADCSISYFDDINKRLVVIFTNLIIIYRRENYSIPNSFNLRVNVFRPQPNKRAASCL